MYIYQCEDSLESIFTAIYNVYEDKRNVEETKLSLSDELMLFASYVTVKVDINKVSKVIRSLNRYFGEEDYLHLCYALASPSPNKAQAVYGTIAAGLDHLGVSTMKGHLFDNLANDAIHLAFTLGKTAANEHHHLLGFLRFQELENQILFAKIGPKNNILTFLMPHFADRLPKENFVIYDDQRDFFGVHPAGGTWYLMEGREDNRMGDGIGHGRIDRLESRWSESEREYQELFRSFCHRIAIKERKNLKCQRNMLPLRFQEYMIEFQTYSQKCNLGN
jgi:probable DNA metabolism protein